MDLLEESSMYGCKLVDSPMDLNTKFGLEEGEPFLDLDRYRRIIGKLIYLIVTRRYIRLVVGVVSQFMHTLHQPHWDIVYKILRYLKGGLGKGILYTPS